MSNKAAAIRLTELGLESEREYVYQHETVTLSVYPLMAPPIPQYFVEFRDSGKVISNKKFDTAGAAAYAFATAAWTLMGK